MESQLLEILQQSYMATLFKYIIRGFVSVIRDRFEYFSFSNIYFWCIFIYPCIYNLQCFKKMFRYSWFTMLCQFLLSSDPAIYIYIYIHIYIHIYTHIYIHIYTHIYIHIYIHTHIYTHTYTHFILLIFSSFIFYLDIVLCATEYRPHCLSMLKVNSFASTNPNFPVHPSPLLFPLGSTTCSPYLWICFCF